jgi:phenylalanyl-tRNA synthetase beta chain
MVPRAIDRAALLIAQLSGGTVAQGVVDMYPGVVTPPAITLRPARVVALLGIEVSKQEVADILLRLECTVQETADGTLEVIPPTYRIDIEREIDLVEEVARMKGFDSIPATMPIARVVSDRPTLHQRMERSVRDILVGHGLNEIINFSFISPDAADKLLLSADDIRRTGIKLANPLVTEQSIMRTSLLPGVLETVARNISFRTMDLKLFEIRRRYLPTTEEMPHEPLCIAGALTGSRVDSGWSSGRDLVDFYDVKGIVENLLELLQIRGVRWVADTPETYYHPGKSCSVMVGRELVGTLGEIHPTVQANFEIEKPVYAFELDFAKIVKLSSQKRSITAPSRFPDSTRDVALLAPDDLPAEKLLDCIKSVKAGEIEQVEIFDVYRGAGIQEGCKSIAIRIRYRSYERTLTDDEIGGIHAKVIAALMNKLNVSIR